MNTLIVAVLSFLGFIVAYHTYGRWLAKKLFGLDPDAPVPSQQFGDGVDFVPSKRSVLFGHHFTSIAGTGPIVGPAIAVFWGWLPALLWVIFGSIFIGAVHDFGALVISMRNRGQTIGEVAGRMINPRAKVLFLVILFFSLTIVLGIFGLVIAIIFAIYPESVLSVWVEIPLAVAIGYWVYKRKGGLFWPSIAALAVMYAAVWVGAYLFPVDFNAWFGMKTLGATYMNSVVVWTLILFAYCFVASVLPVWALLQPRDYINSHQLLLVLALLVVGLFVACLGGGADLFLSAPARATDVPSDAPPIFPFLFITIACGAISGFHCLVSSGTSSKQIATETDAQQIGYGAMLLEGALAVVVILACCAGVGMGAFTREIKGNQYEYIKVKDASGRHIQGRAAWGRKYNPDVKSGGGWKSYKLPQKIGAFIEGGANFLTSLRVPLKLAIALLAVLVASFAATTLDTATRLQRYVIQELSASVGVKPLTNKYAATALALLLGGAVAIFSGDTPGKGGMILWPLFGATNQLLAGLAFMVIVFYLHRRSKPVWFAAIPMVVMLVMPAAAMMYQMFDPDTGWLKEKNYFLFSFGLAIQGIQVWMIIEGLLMWRGAKGNYPEATASSALAGLSGGGAGGRSS